MGQDVESSGRRGEEMALSLVPQPALLTREGDQPVAPTGGEKYRDGLGR